MEEENTTGIHSGLTRMKILQDCIPSYMTRYVIVAPDENREKVFKEVSKEQYHSLTTKYISNSFEEELFVLCQRKKLRALHKSSWIVLLNRYYLKNVLFTNIILMQTVKPSLCNISFSFLSYLNIFVKKYISPSSIIR